MLKGAAHIHFKEGERGPEEATLGFREAIRCLENSQIEEVVATFHLRHPTDLRLARPNILIELVTDYNGPIKLSLMPEANMVFHQTLFRSRKRVFHDIDIWKNLDIQQDLFTKLLSGWIVSAHFTTKLGWTKTKDADLAPEQTYQYMLPLYKEIIYQDWHGWIGHPFKWCIGNDSDRVFQSFLSAAHDTGRIVEIPINQVRRYSKLSMQIVRESILQFRPEIIAKFGVRSTKTNTPLVAITLDAHNLSDLESGLEKTFYIAEYLIQEGVQPSQIWGWRT
jgi:hypothetical protein